MLSAGAKNLDLTKYLVEQVLQDKEDKFSFLQQYYPEAKIEDWEQETAGQRVQIIKKDGKKGGKLQFGTEVVSSSDGTLSALLGASPGASTSVSTMLEVLAKCFPDNLASPEWTKKIKTMIPSYGQSLITNKELLDKTRARTTDILKLEEDLTNPE
jgi:malate dehydrogenase (quinone)